MRVYTKGWNQLRFLNAFWYLDLRPVCRAILIYRDMQSRGTEQVSQLRDLLNHVWEDLLVVVQICCQVETILAAMQEVSILCFIQWSNFAFHRLLNDLESYLQRFLVESCSMLHRKSVYG